MYPLSSSISLARLLSFYTTLNFGVNPISYCSALPHTGKRPNEFSRLAPTEGSRKLCSEYVNV